METTITLIVAIMAMLSAIIVPVSLHRRTANKENKIKEESLKISVNNLENNLNSFKIVFTSELNSFKGVFESKMSILENEIGYVKEFNQDLKDFKKSFSDIKRVTDILEAKGCLLNNINNPSK
jgi:uncharacterized ion transporter superfamily protein YfcC